jgi:hypothetical protein
MAPALVGVGAVTGLAGAALGGPGWAGSTDVPEQQRTALVQALGGNVASVPLPDLTAAAVVRTVARFTPLRAEVVVDMALAPEGYQSNYRALRDRGFGDALEIRYTAAGFTGAKEEALSLFVTAEAYLIDTGTGKPTWFRGLVYESPNHSANRWLQEDALLMRVALERAYTTLAERIVDLLVLATQPSTREANWQANTCGVELLEPGPVLEPVPQFGPAARTATPIPALARADSLTPALAWTALPAQRSSFGGSPWAAANDLRYDLRVWKAVDDAPADVVYERFGLSGTRHQVSFALEPATTYFWSVRVRGAVDGRPQAAAWSFSVSPQFRSTRVLDEARFYALEVGGRLTRNPCVSSWIECGCMDFIPASNFYRFRTP